MTTRGLHLLILSSLCTVGANLLMRGGILRAGGFTLSFDLPPINRSKFNVRFGLEKGGQDGKAEAHRRADHQ